MLNIVKFICLLMVFAMPSMVQVQAGQASVVLTATHKILSAPMAKSSGIVTLSISITNISTTTLSNITIIGTGDISPVDPATGSLSIALLPAGQTITVPWSFSVKQYRPQGFFRFKVSGLDSLGNVVTIGMTSIGGGQQ